MSLPLALTCARCACSRHTLPEFTYLREVVALHLRKSVKRVVREHQRRVGGVDESAPQVGVAARAGCPRGDAGV